MNIPSFFDLIGRTASWQGWPAAVLVLLTAVVIVAINDWRLSIVALAIHYLFAALLYATLLDPRLVAVKLLTGWFVCLMLAFTARQMNWGRPPVDTAISREQLTDPPRQLTLGGFSLTLTRPVRLGVALGVVVLLGLLASRSFLLLPLVAETAVYLNVAIIGLGVLGLLGMVLTSEPLGAGMAMLLFISAFELYYSSTAQSVTMLALLALLNLGMTLVVAYLAQAHYLSRIRLAD